MPGESPQFNPSERLPFGIKVPDSAEYKAAVEEYDKKKAITQAEKEKQAEMKKTIIIPPEKAAQMRAEWEEEIKKARKKIQGMH